MAVLKPNKLGQVRVCLQLDPTHQTFIDLHLSAMQNKTRLTYNGDAWIYVGDLSDGTPRFERA